MAERTAGGSVNAVEVRHHDEPLVSIVVVTYGTGRIVLDCLTAIAANTVIPYEVIVVANPPASPEDDPSVALLRAESRGVTLVASDENLGFAGGNELGVEHARGTYICFLNPDAIVGPGWLEPLVAALDDERVGVAAPVLIDPDGSLQEAGQLLYDDGGTAAIGGPEVLSGDETQAFSRDVDYASAACWLVRRDEHLQRGGFDLRYHPAFFEDVDYALRVEHGGQVSRLVAGRPVVHHHGMGGAGRGHGVAAVSQQTFRALWSERLARQPSRPSTDHEAIRNRDRTCTRRIAFVADGSVVAERRVVGLREAVDLATSSPRDRVTFITGEADGLDVVAARNAGVEVITGDVERALADRAPHLTELHDIADDGRRPWRAVVVAGVVVAVALAGVVARWLILRSSLGALNADEAYTGVQAFEILDGHLPVVIGGTVYTAVVESYVYAPIAALFGAHILHLKLVAVAFWAIAALVVLAIGSELAGRRAGAIAAALVWITPGALLTVSTNAYESYGSGMATTVVAFYLSRRLCDGPAPSWRGPAAVGIVAGLGFWMHPMYLTTLVPMLSVVLWVHRRRLVVWTGIVVGGVVGCAPFLLWNARNGWPSLDDRPEAAGSYTDRLRTFVTDLLPRSLGLRDSQLEWMLGPALGITLYCLFLAAVVVGLVVQYRHSRRPSRVLLPVVVVAVLPLMGLFSPLIYSLDGRYGIIAFPFLALSVGIAIDELARRIPRVGAVAVPVVAVLIWVGGYLAPHLELVLDETDGNPNADTEEVVELLQRSGIEFVSGSFWRVHPVEFVADDTIVGGVSPGHPVRFSNRQRAVEAAAPEDVAFVFQTSDEDPGALRGPVEDYERTQIGDTVLYIPTARD